MRRNYIFLSLLCASGFVVNCTDYAKPTNETNVPSNIAVVINANNSNVANANVNNNSANANAGNSSNTKTANSKVTNSNSELSAIPNAEVPTYTSASDALAEGNKFLDAGEEEKAVNAFQQAFKLDPNPAEAHFQLAVAYENLAVEADDTKP
ncbi:MAG: tetratricopeptide repeat protein, partial [Pyrinomonadaceae bacterium]|nr:tetratricopeptide repeat protein [Pyrinomonadaceae bacterium]